MNTEKLIIGKTYTSKELVTIKQNNYNSYVIAGVDIEKDNNDKYKILQIIDNCRLYLYDSYFYNVSQTSYGDGLIIVQNG